MVSCEFSEQCLEQVLLQNTSDRLLLYFHVLPTVSSNNCCDKCGLKCNIEIRSRCKNFEKRGTLRISDDGGSTKVGGNVAENFEN